jgi:protein-disulfide isomerase/uncharacterized membrane protein
MPAPEPAATAPRESSLAETGAPRSVGREPSAVHLVVLAALASFAGAIAAVQTHQHLTLVSLAASGRSACSASAYLDCDAVYASRYSDVLGVPVSTWGLAAYLVMTALLVIGLAQAGDFRRILTGAVFGLLVLACAASVVLFSISVGVLGVLCPLCTAVHGLNVILLAVCWHALGRPLASTRSGLAGLAAAAAHGGKRGIFLARRTVYTMLAVLVLAAGAAGLAASKVVQFWIVSPGMDVPEKVAEFFKGKIHEIDLSRAPVLGRPDAPVTVVEFGDFECPICRSAFWLYKSLLKEYGDRVRIAFKHFPLDQKCNGRLGSSPHPNACLAAKAAVFAQEQGKFWEHAEALFGHTQPLTQEVLAAAAEGIGLDMKAWWDFMRTKETGGDVILKDIDEARRIGATGTPAFFFNGRRLEAAHNPRLVRAVVDAILSGRGNG